MGKTVDEFADSLKGLQGLGVRGIWDTFINGSTEAADALEKDKKLIEEFKTTSLSKNKDKNASQAKETLKICMLTSAVTVSCLMM